MNMFIRYLTLTLAMERNHPTSQVEPDVKICLKYWGMQHVCCSQRHSHDQVLQTVRHVSGEAGGFEYFVLTVGFI